MGHISPEEDMREKIPVQPRPTNRLPLSKQIQPGMTSIGKGRTKARHTAVILVRYLARRSPKYSLYTNAVSFVWSAIRL